MLRRGSFCKAARSSFALSYSRGEAAREPIGFPRINQRSMKTMTERILPGKRGNRNQRCICFAILLIKFKKDSKDGLIESSS